MNRLRDTGRVLWRASTIAVMDFRAIYTWRTWTFAWLVRILFQVSLFALVGRMIGAPEKVAFLVIGNSVYMVAHTATQVVSSTGWERMAGTLPLLVSSPSAPLVVFFGRSVQWLADGLGCSLISLFGLSAVFGVHLPMPEALLAVPVLVLTSLSVYCLGLLVAAFALRVSQARGLIASVSGLVLMLLTGVQVAISFWPTPVTWIARLLPLTHGLQAIRTILASGPAGQVLAQCGIEAVVGFGWLLGAAWAFRQLVESGRRDGSIEFGG